MNKKKLAQELLLVAKDLVAVEDWRLINDAKWAIDYLVMEYGNRLSVDDVINYMEVRLPKSKARKIVEMGAEEYRSEMGGRVKIVASERLSAEGVFDVDDKDSIIREVKSKIDAEVVRASISTLGGDERASLMLAIGFDPKEEWANNIFENSRYFRIRINRDGTMEQFVQNGMKKKLRKTRVKSIADAIKKLNNYIKQTGVNHE